MSGCGGDEGSGPSHGALSGITVVDGDGQAALPNAPLTDDLIAQAVDDQYRPVPGVRVRWLVLAGGGVVTPFGGNTTTDAQGRVRARWTLGETGPQRVSVGIELPAGSLRYVVFTATATEGSSTP
jgi:hypothetical protein